MWGQDTQTKQNSAKKAPRKTSILQRCALIRITKIFRQTEILQLRFELTDIVSEAILFQRSLVMNIPMVLVIWYDLYQAFYKNQAVQAVAYGFLAFLITTNCNNIKRDDFMRWFPMFIFIKLLIFEYFNFDPKLDPRMSHLVEVMLHSIDMDKRLITREQ